MRLNELRDNPGAFKTKKRLGRGIGSGKGKTSGRGHKGLKARSGATINGFEGGQMPLYRRLPKRGFSNQPFKKDLVEVNVGRIQQAVDAGKLDANATVDAAALIASGVIRRERDGVSLLSNGDLTTKLDIHVYRASKGAVEAVEKSGGSLKTDYVAKRKRERGGK